MRLPRKKKKLLRNHGVFMPLGPLSKDQWHTLWNWYLGLSKNYLVPPPHYLDY